MVLEELAIGHLAARDEEGAVRVLELVQGQRGAQHVGDAQQRPDHDHGADGDESGACGKPARARLLALYGLGATAGLLVLDLGFTRAQAPPPGLAAILGHLFPVWFGFRGGKGVATGCGVFVALYPFAGVAALALFVVLVVATRIVSIGSLAAALSVPPVAWLLARAGWSAPVPAATLGIASICTLLVVLRHASNLRRLLSGTERRLGERGGT